MSGCLFNATSSPKGLNSVSCLPPWGKHCLPTLNRDCESAFTPPLNTSYWSCDKRSRFWRGGDWILIPHWPIFQEKGVLSKFKASEKSEPFWKGGLCSGQKNKEATFNHVQFTHENSYHVSCTKKVTFHKLNVSIREIQVTEDQLIVLVVLQECSSLEDHQIKLYPHSLVPLYVSS